MRLVVQFIIAALLLLAAIIPWFGFANLSLGLLAVALGLVVLLPFLGIRTVGFLGRTDASRFMPSQFNYEFDGSTPLPSGVTGVAGGTTGVTVVKDRGEVQVGFGSDMAVSVFGAAEVGQTFLSIGRDQQVTATLYVQYDYSYDLGARARADIDIEVFVVSSGPARPISNSIVSLSPTGPASDSDQSMNPAFDPTNPPPPPLDERTLGFDVTFTKRRDTRYTVGLGVSAELNGAGRVQVKGILKEIRLRRTVL